MTPSTIKLKFKLKSELYNCPGVGTIEGAPGRKYLFYSSGRRSSVMGPFDSVEEAVAEVSKVYGGKEK